MTYDEIVNEYKTKLHDEVAVLISKKLGDEETKKQSHEIINRLSDEAIVKIENLYNTDMSHIQKDLEAVRAELIAHGHKNTEEKLSELRQQIKGTQA